MHRVLILEVLKPSVFAHWHIFWMHCCSHALLSRVFRSKVDTEVIDIELVINSRIEALCNIVNFQIEYGHWQNTPLRDSLPSCLWKLERVDPTRTPNFLSERKLLRKLGNMPSSPRLCRYFIIPNFLVLSEASSRSKKTAIRCCIWIFASLIEVFNLILMCLCVCVYIYIYI